MTIAALIIVVVSAAVAAALGFGAAVAARRFWRVAYPLHWSAIAGGLVGAIAAVAVISGSLASLLGGGEEVAVDDVLPYMQTIKSREPALYERIETSVIRDLYDGLDAGRVRSNAKALVASYVADKALFLPDDLTYELAAATRDQLAFLTGQGEYDACAGLALGRVGGDDAKLSDELVERNNNNTQRVILAPARKDALRMPAEEFAQLVATAFAEASQKTGIAPEEVDTLLAGGGDSAKTCKLMKAFFDALLAHPVDVAAAALRTMASGERRSNNF